MAKSADQKTAIAKAYGAETPSSHGEKSGADFQLRLSPRQLDRVAKQREELLRRLEALTPASS